MEESGVDDYSDYLTTYSVRPYPTVGEDNAPFACAASSTPSRSHLHVRFSHHTVDDSDDGEYEVESRIICLSEDVLAEESGIECRSFIFSEGLCYWPIDADTVLNIADEVVEKALRFKCDLRVDIRSVQIRGSEDVQETCVICLEELKVGRDVAVMPCSHHSFHDDCLSSWLEISPSCPLCRRKMSAATAAVADSRS
nr:E3 ubiquitin-protein ligase Praja-2-like [Ipomoea batatas]